MKYFIQHKSLYLIAAVASVLILNGCENRPAGEKWKFASYNPEIQTNKNIIYKTIRLSDSGDVTDQAFKEIHAFIYGHGFKKGDVIQIDLSNNMQQKQAADLIFYWLKSKDIPSKIIQSTRKTEIENIQISIRRVVLELPECAQQMHSEITSVNSMTRTVHGCATQANLIHMISNPRHIKEGSQPAYQDGEYAAQKYNAFRSGQRPDLIIDQLDAINNAEEK